MTHKITRAKGIFDHSTKTKQPDEFKEVVNLKGKKVSTNKLLVSK